MEYRYYRTFKEPYFPVVHADTTLAQSKVKVMWRWPSAPSWGLLLISLTSSMYNWCPLHLKKNYTKIVILGYLIVVYLHCFDTVGWAAGRAFGL